MKIFLIRHGEQLYPYDKQGRKMVSGLHAPLVELGRKQLKELGASLVQAGEKLDALYTSPILRARQSASELATTLSLTNITVVDGLKETFPNGAEGRTYDEIEKRGGDLFTYPFTQDQESLAHLVERSRQALEFILHDAKQHNFFRVGIIGHGEPLFALDWKLKHQGFPASYAEMEKEFYPQKGIANMYTISDDEPFRAIGERRIITTEAAAQSIEGFRNPNKEIR